MNRPWKSGPVVRILLAARLLERCHSERDRLVSRPICRWNCQLKGQQSEIFCFWVIFGSGERIWQFLEPEARYPSLGRWTQSRFSWQVGSPWKKLFHFIGYRGVKMFLVCMSHLWHLLSSLPPRTWVDTGIRLRDCQPLDTSTKPAQPKLSGSSTSPLLVASVGGDEKNVSTKLDVVRVALT